MRPSDPHLLRKNPSSIPGNVRIQSHNSLRQNRREPMEAKPLASAGGALTQSAHFVLSLAFRVASVMLFDLYALPARDKAGFINPHHFQGEFKRSFINDLSL